MAADEPNPNGGKKTRRRPKPPPAVKLEPLGTGRPQSYRPEFDELAYRMALLGLDDAEMAAFFNIAPATLYRWDEAHPDFRDARARGKAPADAEVAAKLYHRARGYEHEDVHITTIAGEVVQTPIVRHYPPDTQAATWWLKNRHPKKWKDKFDVETEIGPNTVEAMLARIEREQR